MITNGDYGRAIEALENISGLITTLAASGCLSDEELSTFEEAEEVLSIYVRLTKGDCADA